MLFRNLKFVENYLAEMEPSPWEILVAMEDAWAKLNDYQCILTSHLETEKEAGASSILKL